MKESAVALKAGSGPRRREKNTARAAVPQIASRTFKRLPFSKKSASWASRKVAAIQGKSGFRVPSEYHGYHEPSMVFDMPM